MSEEVLKTPGKRRVGDGTPGPGRPKGLANKITTDVKAMILQALDGAGGVKYLQRQADANPSAFLTLVGKVLPKELTGSGGSDLFPQGKVRSVRSYSDEELMEIIMRSGERPPRDDASASGSPEDHQS